MVQKSLKNRFINLKMKQGKKSVSEKQLFISFKLFQKSTRKNMNFLLKHALIKVTPLVCLKKVTRSTDNTSKEYPYVLKKNRRIAMSLKQLAKPSSIFGCFTTHDWVKVLNEKSDTNFLLQEQTLQQKKLLRYRWFI
jgi:ribosomal protein S7